MRKLGTEQKIKNDGLIIKIGTTDKQKPSVMYAEYNFFIEPSSNFDFTRTITGIKNKVSYIGKNIANCKFFNENMIAITDTSIDRLCVGKKSMMTIQYYFRCNGQYKYIDMMEYLSDTITSKNQEVFDYIRSNGFICTKTKK